ncbi:hypothetical protein H6G17_20010 [Chroococcidiopsis sp. FACHB-1243]|uniref:hypothetical protein n=1 Tax=Chroococcidiopsis sp. [FACHB-1243] TaxID=2692781 RepID=UPI001784A0EB|nr:hypothetical protein [Chroococcidiopsis sp. [FACHB-1243]]MBD2307757.1 hypothetical protein [Chroococcidiopsis sp. [FACHB-1243]]
MTAETEIVSYISQQLDRCVKQFNELSSPLVFHYLGLSSIYSQLKKNSEEFLN